MLPEVPAEQGADVGDRAEEPGIQDGFRLRLPEIVRDDRAVVGIDFGGRKTFNDKYLHLLKGFRSLTTLSNRSRTEIRLFKISLI